MSITRNDEYYTERRQRNTLRSMTNDLPGNCAREGLQAVICKFR